MENQEEQIFTNVKSINYWVFDLDNTIYRSNTNLFLQVEKKIGKGSVFFKIRWSSFGNDTLSFRL